MKLRNKKTGEIKEWQRVGAIDYGEMNEVYDAAEYDSLAELNETWEDYEPLIKDEKIRKAVRAWYEINFTDKPIYLEDSLTLSIDHSPRFEVIKKYYFANLVKAKPYTIAELCGEEE